MVEGWDIEPFYNLGYGYPFDFGGNAKRGTGDAADTVQFGFGSPRVYYASSVNYALFGGMWYLFHYFYTRDGALIDPTFSETAAVTAARTWKALGHHNVFNGYATEAEAFVKFGYSGMNPSSTALPIAPNPQNAAPPTRFRWKWLGLTDGYK